MGFRTLLYEAIGSTGLVYFNRPEKMNSFNSLMVRETRELAEKLKADESIRSVVISGKGRAFSTGIDLKEMSGLGRKDFGKLVKSATTAFLDFMGMHKPVIAAVNGYAYGGGAEIAINCDYVIAASNASLCFPEINFGYVPFLGSIHKLHELAGKQRANELVMLGKKINAKKMREMGIANEVTGKKNLIRRALQVAQEMNKKPLGAMSGVKRLVRKRERKKISAAIAEEQMLFWECYESNEWKKEAEKFLGREKK
ncbi:MAG: enoyl-CoA hydratase/isomerase family protein [Candidatus Diapherotrites archaeon]